MSSPRQDAARSRSCSRVFDLDLDLSSSVGNAAVGFLNATERKRTDSILAEGTKERMCRLNCFWVGYSDGRGMDGTFGIDDREIRTLDLVTSMATFPTNTVRASRCAGVSSEGANFVFFRADWFFALSFSKDSCTSFDRSPSLSESLSLGSDVGWTRVPSSLSSPLPSASDSVSASCLEAFAGAFEGADTAKC